MNEANNIELLRYINGELSRSEKLAFEESLANDVSLQDEEKIYKELIHGVKLKERQKMKANIAAIGATLPLSSLRKYQAKTPPSGGGKMLGKAFKFLFFSTIVAAVGSVLLIALDKFPLKHPAVEIIQEKILELEQITVIDTVWTTIESEVVPGDTVFYSQEEYDAYLKKIEEADRGDFN